MLQVLKSYVWEGSRFLAMAKKLCSLVGNYKLFEAIYYLSFRSGTLKTAAVYSKTAVNNLRDYCRTPQHDNKLRRDI